MGYKVGMADPTGPQDAAPMDAPRERLWNLGPGCLGTAELLTALLGSGCRKTVEADLGHELIRSFGSLEAMARCPEERLLGIPGMGRGKVAALKAAFEVARRLALEARAACPVVDSPEAVARLLRGDWATLEAERFVVQPGLRHLLDLAERPRVPERRNRPTPRVDQGDSVEPSGVAAREQLFLGPRGRTVKCSPVHVR